MHLVIFDDKRYKSFYPASQLRSVGDIRCGILKLRQRLIFELGFDKAAIIVRPGLDSLYRYRQPDWRINDNPEGKKLYVNSRLKIGDEIIKQIKDVKEEEALVSNGDIVAIRTEKDLAFGFDRDAFYTREIDAKLYKNMVDVVHDNGRLITRDFENIFYEEENFFEIEPGVHVLHPYNVWIGENVKLAPNVVLDASEGPIVIDEDASVMANAVIVGPAYIGKGSLVKISAKIYGGSSIGPICKVGGEIESSIFQAYSNKQHDGFLGHSYVGEWVNIGADTNNSDLKNNYKNVFQYSYESGELFDSGTQFMGSLIADHVKIGINCSLNTGLVIGLGANIYGNKLFSGFVPDFSWGEADSLNTYRIDEFLDTAGKVKSRRRLELQQIESELLKLFHGE